MKPEALLEVYDAAYAATYNERFLLPSYARETVEGELAALRPLLGEGARWLDVGCGTGYMLSQFPGVARAGLDKSPGMLGEARRANPDALFLQEGDFRDAHPEWREAWSLVSCMWGAYIYVDSVAEVEQVVANLIAWTQPGGHVYLPVIDGEDMSRPMPKYEEVVIGFGGLTRMVASVWDWHEYETGQLHKQLISPHPDHLLRLMAPHFEHLELLRFPVPAPEWPSRKAILASGRRAQPNPAQPATITYQSIPSSPFLPAELTPQDQAAKLPYQVLIAELAQRFRPAHLLPALKRRLGM